jgi:membrane protease YdiL (CAAX protease family)
VALFGYVAIWPAAIAIGGDARTEIAEAGPLLALIPIFLMYVLQAVPEEVAWRGFALPRLQSRHSALLSSLIVGVLSALWHLPLLLTEGSVMATYP